MSKRVLLICGISQTVITFRLGLIKALQNNGYSVAVIALDEDYRDDIVEKGIEFYSVNSQNRSLNPFGMRKLQKKYKALIKCIQPEIVFTFMLKPNIFGIRAARKVGVQKIFSMVEGAGDVFINKGLKWRIIRSVVCKMYRKSFKYANKVFFLNNDDKAEFVERKLVKPKQCEVIPGIGVDIEYFAFKPIKNYRTFLMIARMLKTKGVMEYCRAARIVKQQYPDAIFNYLGAEGTVKVSDIQEYIDDGSINYLGTTKDVRPYLEDCSVYVLPSYREGMPMSIMEAESVGRAIITTNDVGCRETVKEDYNGFLIGKKNYIELSEKIIECIENPQQTEICGINGRTFAEEHFAQDVINDMLLDAIQVPIK